MIQRIQSIYLFSAALATGLYFALPFALFSFMGANVEFNLLGLQINNVESFPHLPQMALPVEDSHILLIVASVLATLAILIIFLFRNRILQIRLCYFAMLLCLGMISGIFLKAGKIQETLGEEPQYGLGCIVPFIQLLLIFLANRSIRKDEELVRSADRLR